MSIFGRPEPNIPPFDTGNKQKGSQQNYLPDSIAVFAVFCFVNARLGFGISNSSENEISKFSFS